MEPQKKKLNITMKNNPMKVLLFFFALCLLFAYFFIIMKQASCNEQGALTLSVPHQVLKTAVVGGRGRINSHAVWVDSVEFHTILFRRLVVEGYLSPSSKALSIGYSTGQDVAALKAVGLVDVKGVSDIGLNGLSHTVKLPFDDKTFDFEFVSHGGRVDWSFQPLDSASEIGRTLKPGGFLVLHTMVKDVYSFNSFVDMFTCCELVSSEGINGVGSLNSSSLPSIREIVLVKKEIENKPAARVRSAKFFSNCSVPKYKRELVNSIEPLITEEPNDEWNGLEDLNIVKYLTSMVDISFRRRYIYVDLGARNYDSSIGSWFEKQYPKQGKNFEIYAVEADRDFQDEYKKMKKKGLTLMPYAAWVRNETLHFKVARETTKTEEQKWRRMGRLQSVMDVDMGNVVEELEVEAIDFAEWMKNTISEEDFVVMKMDIEGAEMELVKRFVETGVMCLVDELLLECHWNRWLKCCSGERETTYKVSFDQCLDLFSSLRQSGHFVHQWW